MFYFLIILQHAYYTGKNNGFPFWDILGYLKNTHKNPKFGRVKQVPIWELSWEFPGWDLSHFCQIWDFYGYFLNTLKIYPKMGIRYFFLCYRYHLIIGRLMYVCRWGKSACIYATGNPHSPAHLELTEITVA